MAHYFIPILSIYPQAPFPLSLSLSPPPPLLSPSAQSTSSTSLLSPCGLLECQSIEVSTLSYLRYLRYLSQVHVTKGMHHPYKIERSICT